MSRYITTWRCENCATQGDVEHERDEGVWSVVQSIGDDHREKSPKCSGNLRQIRIARVRMKRRRASSLSSASESEKP